MPTNVSNKKNSNYFVHKYLNIGQGMYMLVYILMVPINIVFISENVTYCNSKAQITIVHKVSRNISNIIFDMKTVK